MPFDGYRIEEVAFKSNEKSSTTHHTEVNSMTSPTQTVVGKDILNPLMAEGLLKILRDLLSLPPLKSLANSRPWNGNTSKRL